MGINSVGVLKDTTDVELYHPKTGQPLFNTDGSKMTVTVHGPYSAKYKAISHAQQNRRLAKAQRTGGKLNLTAEELEASQMDLLIKCTSGWAVTLEDSEDAPQVPFSEAAVRELYEQHPWVRTQVEAVLGDERAFLG